MNNRDDSIMVILSSPSGAGKTTISKKIQQKYQNFKISVSHTTRKPRPNEVDGVDYFFIDKNEFEKKITNNEFYEYAKIFDNYYGTSKISVTSLVDKKNDILFDIDWQGTQQLSKFKELKLIKIYILPPNKEELQKRLIQRNQDKPNVVAKRIESYDEDIIHWSDYNYVIINDNLEICFKQIEEIILLNKKKKVN
ncbi:MAG: guanylate kinase [Pelagibacterales bacterium]|jgi:guanylate kinase|nr:guanylate kinase [Pelagibacterales bacterium]